MPWWVRRQPRNYRVPSVQDIESLLGSEWTSRIWTFQEAVLANRPVIVCGSYHIEWRRLAFTVAFLAYTNQSTHFQTWTKLFVSRALVRAQMGHKETTAADLELYRKFWDRVFTIHYRLGYVVAFLLPLYPLIFLIGMSKDLTGMPSQLNAAHSLFGRLRLVDHDIHEHVADSLCFRKATNPRDLSFGLRSVLGLCSAISQDLPAIDYSLPVDQVYTKLTKYLILASNALQPLLLAACKSCPNAPSWVPDYSQVLNPYGLPGGDYYIAIPPSKPCYRISGEDEQTLTVKGLLFGKITALYRFRRTSDIYEQSEDEVHKSNYRLLHCLYQTFQCRMIAGSPADGDGDTAAFVLRRWFLEYASSTKGQAVMDPLALKKCLLRLDDSLRSGIREITNWLKSNNRAGTSFMSKVKRQDLVRTHLTMMNILAQSNTAIVDVESALGKRQYSGYCCSDTIARGDKIYLVSGVSIPLVMRKVEESNKLIAGAILVRFKSLNPWKEVREKGWNAGLCTEAEFQSGLVDIPIS